MLVTLGGGGKGLTNTIYLYTSTLQLKKMFFLFPDPHFKQKKHKWRIIRSGERKKMAAWLP